MENIENAIDPFRFISDIFGVSYEAAVVIFIVLLIWSLTWKGLALWKSAKRDDKGWFVILLVANTLGILDIIYIYLFSKEKEGKITIQ